MNFEETTDLREEPGHSFLDIVYGVIFSPRQTMAIVGQQKPFWSAFALLLAINLLTIMTIFVSFDSYQSFNSILPKAALQPGTLKKVLLVISFCMFFIRLIFLFASAGIYNIFGELLGGKSNGIGLLTALCLTAIPEVFSIPLHLLGVLLPIGKTVDGLGNFLLSLWMLGLSILAIREVLELSTARALLILFLPLLIIFSIIFALVIIATTVFMP